jgi:hypothetical protein
MVMCHPVPGPITIGSPGRASERFVVTLPFLYAFERTVPVYPR